MSRLSRFRGISSKFRESALSWYGKNRRRLPWREKPSPYRTWVSEIMLQQTQVATVIPYFERFLKRFPDISSLAKAREEEVLSLWAGLGYYSRGRNLLRAARKVSAEFGGRLPETLESLKQLPGVGRYTAAAVASIAFGRPHAVLDGNVARVLSRLFALRGEIKSAGMQKKLWALAEACLKKSAPGDWNQAMMELGALVCLPQPEEPRCPACPLVRFCAARRAGLENTLPRAAARKAPVELSWTAYLVERKGKVLLWKRGAAERFLPGHWGLPEARHLPAALAGEPLRTIRHSITHHKIALRVLKAAAPEKLPKGARWTPRSELNNLLVSSLWKKALGA